MAAKDQNLDQDRRQLGRDDFRAAQGVCQQEFSCPVLFLVGQCSDADQCRKQRTADSQDVSALNSVESAERAEVQGVQAESGGKRAHGGEDGTDAVHLALHFGIHKQTDNDKRADRQCPDQQGFPRLLQFMTDQGHTWSPPF